MLLGVLVSIVIVSFYSNNALATVYKLETGVITNIDPQNVTGNWNVIYNGGAETGATYPWSIFPGWMASLGVSSEEKLNGNYSFKMHMKVNNPSGHWGAAAKHFNILITPGIYVISGFFYKDYTISGGMYLDLNDLYVYDTNHNHVNDNIVVDKQALGWQFVYGIFNFTTPTYVSVRVVRDSLFYAGEDFYFDDVAITPIDNFRAPSSVVPEPITSGLFLIGITGIILRKNR